MGQVQGHTPGPWTASEDNNGTYVLADNDVIAHCWGIQERNNSRLIAAAPDLLEALKKILKAHETDNNGAVMGEARLCEYFAKMARSVIAKAEGR